MTISGEKTPVRKSPHFNKEIIDLASTPIGCSRPNFNVDVFTPSQVWNKSGDEHNPSVIVVESSKKKNPVEGAPESLKRKGKEKVDLPADSDFEDELLIMKRYRLNQGMNSANVKGKSPSVASSKVDKSKVVKTKKVRKKNANKSSKYKFKNMLFTPDELSVIRAEELAGSRAIGVSTNDEHPPSNTHTGGSEENIGSSNFEANNFEAYERLRKEISLVRHQLSILEAKVDDQFSEMKIFIEDSFKKFMTETRISRNGDPKSDNSGSTKTCVANQDSIAKDASVNCGLVNQIPTAFMEAEHNQVKPDCANIKEQCVDDAMLSNDGKSILDEFDFPDLTESQFVALENRTPYHTSMQEARAKATGNFQQSPYTELGETDGSSVKRPAIFKRKHLFDQYTNFEVAMDLVDSFQLWIKQKLSKKRDKKQSAFTVASNKINSPFDFGVDRVAQMDWFYDLVTTGRPWGDSHIDIIMYYLRKKNEVWTR